MSESYVLFRADTGDGDNRIYFALNADLAATMRDLAVTGGDFHYMVSGWSGIWAACGRLRDDMYDWMAGKGFSVATGDLEGFDELEIDPPSGDSPEVRISLNPGGVLHVWIQGADEPAGVSLSAYDVATSALMAIDAIHPGVKPKSLWNPNLRPDNGEAAYDAIVVENEFGVSVLAAFPKGELETAGYRPFAPNAEELGQYVSLTDRAVFLKCFAGSCDKAEFLSMTALEIADFLESRDTDAGAEVRVTLNGAGKLDICVINADIGGNPARDEEYSAPLDEILKAIRHSDAAPSVHGKRGNPKMG